MAQKLPQVPQLSGSLEGSTQEPEQFARPPGQPARHDPSAQTIAARGPEELLIVYPRLKRAERYALTGAATGPWSEGLSLFEAGFPRGRADLERGDHQRLQQPGPRRARG